MNTFLNQSYIQKSNISLLKHFSLSSLEVFCLVSYFSSIIIIMSVSKKLKHLEIQLHLIKAATNDFAVSHHIGEGGFGDVYKGELLQLNGQTMVALKRSKKQYDQSKPVFWNEVMTLSIYKHENIVPLIGFCEEKGEKILVYKYASKGSLDSHLKSKDLTWVQRLKICIGAARGLSYLHNPTWNQVRVLHRDIKSSNIILDEDWNAMIADFGLSIRVPIKQEYSFMVSDACGTIGYCDPLYAETGFLTKESDVYSFGVVLFEVLCGRFCIDEIYEHRRLTDLIQICYNNLEEVIYDGIKDEINPSSLQEFTTIAYQCLKRDREDRPLMDDVVRKLESALKYQLEPIEIQREDIISATNNFVESNCICESNFGKVYKGKLVLWKEPTMVALHRLDRFFRQGEIELSSKISMLSEYRHENIISVLGFCDESGDKIIVQEYASNGSLDVHLGSNHLTWVQRLKICIGMARGLAYLHNPGWTQQRLLHRDISSSNIFLDENWNARVAYMGLSRFGPANQNYTFLVTNAEGTIGYCDPLYFENGMLTKESDVYSLGVVLFEVLCGRLCISNNDSHKSLTRLVRLHYKKNKINEIVYGDMKDEIRPSSLEVFTEIAYRCLKRDHEKRPLPREIVTALETALEHQVPSSFSKSSDLSPPLHWEKTRAMVGSLWDVSHHKQGKQLRAPQIDITELESLFCKPGPEKLEPEDRDLVHPDIASNCQIMIRNINIPRPDIINVILALDSSAVTVDQADDIIKLCPTKEEMEMLMNYTGDMEMLGPCEQFVLECVKIPRIKSKLRVFAFTITFSTQVKYLTDTLNIINDATKEIRESKKLVKIMQLILMMGNRLNAGTTGGSANGFKLDSLQKLGDTYATDKDITLLHFLCKVVAEQMPELLDFEKDLIHLQAAYVHKIQMRTVRQIKHAIVGGFEEVLREFHASANDGRVSVKFRKALKCFLDSAGAELQPLTSLFDEVDQYADSLALYFAEDPNRCPWEQVISSLVRFIVKFKRAHIENKKLEDAEKKKLEESVVEEGGSN